MGHESITEAVDDYYTTLFRIPLVRQHTLNLDILELPSHDLSHLEMPFSIEEVERTNKSMPLDKAPGLDGFTGKFFVSCWSIIKWDFMRALD